MIGLGLDELGEILDFQAAARQEHLHPRGITDRFEMAFKDDTVKAAEGAGNLIGDFVGERFHGVLSAGFIEAF